jgi:hypothetical protein
MPGSFADMFLTVPVSEWKVARERADRAEEQGDSELAEALREAVTGVVERMTTF